MSDTTDPEVKKEAVPEQGPAHHSAEIVKTGLAGEYKNK